MIIQVFNRNTLFNNDLLYHYMLASDLQTKILGLIDKSASYLFNKHFWTDKMKIASFN
jgi:hypothetical protein